MKILITADPEIPIPPNLYGGIERIVEVLINGFIERGHEVILCANPDSKVLCRLIPWTGKHSQNNFDTIRNIITLSKLVWKEKFDIIHSFSRLAYMSAIFPTRIPKIMSYQREPRLIQVKKAVQLSRKGSMIFTGCSDYITNQLSTVSDAYTVYNCAPVERYTFKETVDKDAPLMFLGRIEDIKGTHIAIQVAKKSNKRLIIAGNIPVGKESYFNEQVKPHLSDRIAYVGPVNDEQKNKLLGQALAFLMPIQWNEPFGIVMAEAMACGTPVLGFPLGSVPEVIENGINGFICKNADEMSEKVQKISIINRKNVRKITEERFSNTAVLNEYENLYSKLLKNKHVGIL